MPHTYDPRTLGGRGRTIADSSPARQLSDLGALCLRTFKQGLWAVGAALWKGPELKASVTKKGTRFLNDINFCSRPVIADTLYQLEEFRNLTEGLSREPGALLRKHPQPLQRRAGMV